MSVILARRNGKETVRRAWENINEQIIRDGNREIELPVTKPEIDAYTSTNYQRLSARS